MSADTLVKPPANPRMRILHIVQNLNYGGLERLVADMARWADTDAFDIHIMALGYLGHFSQGLDGFATLHRASLMSRFSMLRPAALAKDLRSIAPDVVHLHSGLWYKASLAARMAGIPRVVYTDHGRQNPDPFLSQTLDRLASRRTDTVVAVSQLLGEQLARIVAYPDRITVIRNGVDTEIYAPAPDDGQLRQELGVGPETPLIGSIGRLEQVKGYDVMIEAFQLFLKQWTGPNRPVLVLVGDGSQREQLEGTAKAAGINDSIRFLGWRSDMNACHRAFTLFTMSSRSEGTSVSLLEAMSAGLCPVVTRVGGNPVVLGDALRHRLVPSEQPAQLANAWRDALENDSRRLSDGAAARARVLSDFGHQEMVRRYEQVYRGA